MKAAAAELRCKKATVSLEETHTDKVRSLTLASDDATVTADTMFILHFSSASSISAYYSNYTVHRGQGRGSYAQPSSPFWCFAQG